MNINQKIEKAKELLLENGELQLIRKCTQEDILHTYTTDGQNVVRKLKEHLDKDTKEVKKCKSSAIFFNIHMFVDVKVYELLENGYELIL